MEKQYLLWIVLISLIGIAFNFRYVARHKHFVCPHCGCPFKISTIKAMVTPHYFCKLYLKCPSCQKRSWTKMESDI